MKIRKDYIPRQIADEYLLIPVGQAALSVKGLIRISESGDLLCRRLQTECSRDELVEALLAEYEVERQVAETDVDEFLSRMRMLGMLIEEEP
jgi:hypothetical protein